MKSSHILVQNHLYKSSPQGQLSHEHVGNSFAFTVAAQCICTAVYLTQSSNAYVSIFLINSLKQLLIWVEEFFVEKYSYSMPACKN